MYSENILKSAVEVGSDGGKLIRVSVIVRPASNNWAGLVRSSLSGVIAFVEPKRGCYPEYLGELQTLNGVPMTCTLNINSSCISGLAPDVRDAIIAAASDAIKLFVQQANQAIIAKLAPAPAEFAAAGSGVTATP